MASVEAAKSYTDLINFMEKAAKAKVSVVLDGRYDGVLPTTSVRRDKEASSKVYERKDIASQYQKALQAGSLDVVTKASILLQHDMLASLHKARRMMYRTPVECFIIGVCRSYGQSQDKGYISHTLRKAPILGR